MGRVIIGMDPHKRSATVEIIDSREKVLAQGRLGTDRDGYTAMLKLGRQQKDRVCRRLTVRLDGALLLLVAEGVLLRSLPNPLTPAEQARIRDARPAGPAPQPASEPQRVQRRVSCRGALMVAGQRIHIGITHAGRTVNVESVDRTFRVYDGDEVLTEIVRTTDKPVARFEVRKPEPSRQRYPAHDNALDEL